MTRGARSLWRAMLTLAVVVLLSIGLTVLVFVRLKTDERATCMVQARGLPAGHHLSAVVGDIGALLALMSPGPSRPVPPVAAHLLIDLKAQAQAYARLESKQPQTRICS